MKWQKESNTATGEIVYSVLDDSLAPDRNVLRPALRDLGFLLYASTRRWSVTVPAADAERIGRIEAFLRESEKGLPREHAPQWDDRPSRRDEAQRGGRPPRDDAPPEPGRRRLTAGELALINALLREASWIYPGEVEFLKSIRGQARAGKSLSARQLQVLQGMPEKIGRRKSPKFFQGGSPGLGKKR